MGELPDQVSVLWLVMQSCMFGAGKRRLEAGAIRSSLPPQMQIKPSILPVTARLLVKGSESPHAPEKGRF
jgi:hypothetical protein